MITHAKAVALVLVTVPIGSTAWKQPGGPTERPRFTVTLLGTGAPGPSIERFGPSTLVEAGDQKLLFDCGRAATIRLEQLRVRLSTVQDVFLTHLHSDHINGLSDFWLTSWMQGAGGGGEHRAVPLRVYGPSGTKDMMMYLELAHSADIRMRRALPRSGPDVKATDISEGVVYDQGGIRVSAFQVDHGEVAKPAFGYRVDYQGRSVVVSGDTKPSANLIRYATAADVLIHEVMSFRDDSLANSQNLQRVMAIHTSPEQAGRVFAEAKPRLAVFTHIVGSAASPAELVARTRTTYSGPLEVGEDLMTIDVWDATARKAGQQEPSSSR